MSDSLTDVLKKRSKIPLKMLLYCSYEKYSVRLTVNFFIHFTMCNYSFNIREGYICDCNAKVSNVKTLIPQEAQTGHNAMCAKAPMICCHLGFSSSLACMVASFSHLKVLKEQHQFWCFRCLNCFH